MILLNSSSYDNDLKIINKKFNEKQFLLNPQENELSNLNSGGNRKK